MLVNPRRKRRRRARGRRRMPAGLARYWATHRRGKRRTVARRRRRRHAAVAVNPRRRRRASFRRHYRRIRRNPSFRGLASSGRGILHGVVVPGAIGAGGAVALDVVMGYATPYLPATLQSGWFNVAVKIAGAVGVGMGVGKVLGRERGRVATIGGVTVVLYGVMRGLLKSVAPSVPGLSGLGMHDYTPYGMGAYIRGPTRTPGIQGLGYVSPAATVGSAVPLSPQMGAYMPRGAMNVVPQMGDYGDGF